MNHLTRWCLRLGRVPLRSGVLTAALLGMPTGCDLFSPEFEVRNLIRHAGIACEQHDAAAFHTLLADDYRDASGRSREEVLRYVENYLLVHRPVSCHTYIARIEPHTDATFHVEVYAALAGQPIPSADALAGMSADRLRLDLDLTPGAQGRLQVTDAHWQPVTTFPTLNAEAP